MKRSDMTYEGEWKMGRISGKGKIKWSNGNIYEGQFKLNHIDGNGYMVWYDLLEKYIGNWKNDKQNGLGMHIWYEPKGELKEMRNRYVGEWADGIREGYGVFFYSNGATYEGEWLGENLPSCTLENQLAILALTLKDNNNGNEITGNVTDVTVKADEDTYTVTRSATAGPIYVAIKPIASKNVVVTTTGGSKKYVKLLTEKTYESGKGYSVSWKMTPIIPFTEATANDVGRVIAIDGKVYDNTTIATAVNAPAVAIISFVGNPRDAEVQYYRGLAIGMSDAVTGRVVWNDAASAAENNNGTVVPGGTSGWFLPSIAQLEKVCQGLATKKKGTAVTTGLSTSNNSDYAYTNLNSIITGAGGTGLLGTDYWSSTESSTSNTVYGVNFNNGRIVTGVKTDNNSTAYVRSVIAF